MAPGPACSDWAATCAYGSLAINGFFSADEDNLNRVIPYGTGEGSCVFDDTTQVLPEIQTCPAANSTKTAFAEGQLAVCSCDGANATNGADPGSPGAPVGAVNGSGNGTPQSPRCEAAPINGSDGLDGSPPPTTIDDVIDYLEDGNKISIALPSADPSGAASRAALRTADNLGDGSPASFTYDDSSGTSAQNAFPAGTGTNQCEGTKTGGLSGATCLVRLEAGISQVRGAVTSGTTRVGIVAVSNVMNIDFTSGTVSSDPGDDPNFWTEIPDTAYSWWGPIEQCAVRLTTGSTTANAAMDDILTNQSYGIRSTSAQGVFASYGFDSSGSGACSR